jgi:mRNA interferase RelE/StbE
VSSTEPYDVQLGSAAARAYQKLPADVRRRVRRALEKLAGDVAKSGRIGGKSVKTIRGGGDAFHRLRVGDHRIMFDVIDSDRVVLVLGIVHRGDLETWLRNR